MGLFGKIFDKKECSICGGEIGLLGNRKLEDGNCCKECAGKLSPWFEERRHSTVEDIRRQLAYREENKVKVRQFRVTREFAGAFCHVFIDDKKGWFAVARDMNEETNPDILELSQVTGCNLNIERNQEELQYEDNQGNLQDYNPPRYKYSYEYSIKLSVNSPWFDDMDFDLHSFDIEEQDCMKMMEMENLGNQIVAALTGTSVNRMYGQQMNMPQNGMYGQQMNMPQNRMYGQQMNMPQNGMYGQQMNMPNNGMYNQNQTTGIRCSRCGWTPEYAGNISNFCPQCGNPIGGNYRE